MSTHNQSSSEKIAEQLHASAIHLLRKLRREDEASGITASRLSALSVIVFGGPLTLGKLAKVEQVRPPTMTRIVNALEFERLIVKTKSETDGRIIQLSATTKGRRLLLAARVRRVRVLTNQIARISEIEQKNLVAALATIQKLINHIR